MYDEMLGPGGKFMGAVKRSHSVDPLEFIDCGHDIRRPSAKVAV